MEIAPTTLGLGPDLEQSLRAIVAHFQAQIGTIHTLESDGMLHMRAHTPGIPDAALDRAALRTLHIVAVALCDRMNPRIMRIYCGATDFLRHHTALREKTLKYSFFQPQDGCW